MTNIEVNNLFLYNYKTMIIKEIKAKTILSASKVYDWTINPYVGCQHACSYCYARFMRRFAKHREPWGTFVDVKINAADLLGREITRKNPGKIWVSGVCDPYQPLEAEYKITRQCLEILAQNKWPVIIQTRSPLVLRDIDILKEMQALEVGLSITTAEEDIRKLFEPSAPPIMERIKALDELHQAGLKTYAMIAPMLPGADGLAELLKGKIDYLIIDRMNYHYADWIYRKYGLEDKLTDRFFHLTRNKLENICK